MQYRGNLSKMRVAWNSPIDYFLQLGDSEIALNPLIGSTISLEYTGVIHCVNCGKITTKSYNQGFCFNCFQTAPEADESVIRPELSMAQFGLARDLDWAKEHDLVDHFVYLAVTNDLKVGVTRFHQIPTRWIDQGAVQAIKLAKTPNRHIAGVIENLLKRFVADRTQWQAMLKEDISSDIHLEQEKKRIGALLPFELQQYLEPDNSITKIVYPGSFILGKIASVSFDKTPVVEGKLVRIKGQYLMFDDGNVLNIRKHAGYSVVFSLND